MDAGTDNGLTFTSPNWATEPRGEIFVITSSFPAHPAASFSYPHFAEAAYYCYVFSENGKVSIC